MQSNSFEGATFVFFDLDDTLYPKSSGIQKIVADRIAKYMSEELGFENAETKSYELYYQYGTTLNGLVHLGYQIEPLVSFYHYVHDFDLQTTTVIEDDRDLQLLLSKLRSKFQTSNQILKIILFTNSDYRHAKRLLKYLNIESYFDDLIYFELNHEHPKPKMESYEQALQIGIELLKNDPKCQQLFQEGMNIKDKTITSYFFDDNKNNVITASKKFSWKCCFIDEHLQRKEELETQHQIPTVSSIYEIDKVFPELFD